MEVVVRLPEGRRLRRRRAAPAAVMGGGGGGGGGGMFPAGLFDALAMATRYETLSATKSAYQAAIPDALFTVLQQGLGVRHECYASPLNHWCPSYCSLFLDVDSFFGLARIVPRVDARGGVYECNPPFNNASVCACFQRLSTLLGTAPHDMPLSFVVECP